MLVAFGLLEGRPEYNMDHVSGSTPFHEASELANYVGSRLGGVRDGGISPIFKRGSATVVGVRIRGHEQLTVDNIEENPGHLYMDK